jgi:uroporphyrinogen III methyltransferase / synthase
VDGLRARGAKVIEVPAIQVRPPDDWRLLDAALARLSSYDWIVFASANGVRAVGERLGFLGLPRRLGRPLASVGPSTTRALAVAFPEDTVALEPREDHRAAGLLAAFGQRGCRGARLLLPASSLAREELPAGLRLLGGHVDVVTAYQTVAPPELAGVVQGALDHGFDAATFASPSAVDSFAAAAGSRGRGLPAVVIGPTTEAAAREAGFEVRAVARPSTAEGLLQALESLFGREGSLDALTGNSRRA